MASIKASQPLLKASGAQTPDFEAEAMQLAAARRMAEMMQQEQGLQAQNVGGTTVQPGWLGFLDKVGRGAIGGMNRSMLDKQDKDLAGRRAEAAETFFTNLAKGDKTVEPQGPMPDGGSMPAVQVPKSPQDRMQEAARGMGMGIPGAKEVFASEVAAQHDQRKIDAAAAKGPPDKWQHITYKNDKGEEVTEWRNAAKPYDPPVPINIAKIVKEDPSRIREIAALRPIYPDKTDREIADMVLNNIKVVPTPGGGVVTANPYADPGTRSKAPPVAPDMGATAVPPPQGGMLPQPGGVGAAPPAPAGMLPQPGQPNWAALKAQNQAAQPAREDARVATLTNEYKAELAAPPSAQRDQNLAGISAELKGMKAAIPGDVPPGAAVPGAPPAPAVREPFKPTPGGIYDADKPPGPGQRVIVKSDAPTKLLAEHTKDYGEKVAKAGIPQYQNALDRVQTDVLDKYANGKIPGVGFWKNALPGLSDEARAVKTALLPLQRIEQKEGGGLTLTPMEKEIVERLTGVNKFNSEADFRQAIKQLGESFEARKAAVRGGVHEDVIRNYNYQQTASQPPKGDTRKPLGAIFGGK